MVIHFKSKPRLITQSPPHLQQTRRDALGILESVLTQIDPYRLVNSQVARKGKYLRVMDKKYDLSSFTHIYLIGFGKASYGMARAVHKILDITEGAIITSEKKTLHPLKTYQGTHPLPSQRNIHATQKLLQIVDKTQENDLLIVLVSGGGSAMLCHPKIPFPQLKKLTSSLLEKGSTIGELNTIRGHLSHVKRGGLAARSKSLIISLIISDVIGDPLEFIASGPTYHGHRAPLRVKAILEKYSLWDCYPAIKDIIMGEIQATQQGKKPSYPPIDNHIIANNHFACTLAMKAARDHGYYPHLLTTTLQGEAREMGRALVDYAKIFPRENTVIIAGGETTVTVTGKGKGGRNQELVLGAVDAIAGTNMVMASCGTDGKDGFTPAAGAIADGSTLQRAQEKGLHPPDFLGRNDSYTFFEKLNDLLITGPTGTNVMDLQVLMIPRK